MVTGLEVARLPAASRATAVRAYVPSGRLFVFAVAVYGGEVSSASKLMPLYWNWTPATPTLSEASAATVIVPETVAPDAGDVILTVGGVVSGLGHVNPGKHGTGNCSRASSGIQARLKMRSRAAA